uniref:DUF202 domain-containing protein n=1 Tax=Hemiselmis andersenii TaxID=464988 RepID=A0A6U4M4B5_HEMAN|mmetsp:Transcript_34135/g.80028  ORF Transcript_34135/g.80028 Transcript_34135/m.80028 type:complete len:138 (-) Transcript_34135:78-491(-)
MTGQQQTVGWHPIAWLNIQGSNLASNESKNLFANERTFIHWVHMSVVMGSIATGLLSFANRQKDKESQHAIQLLAALLIFSAISFIVYALGMFLWRRKVIALRLGNGEAPTGPLVLSSVFALCLVCIFFVGVVQPKT